jgi:hypothetical protein
MTGATRTPRVLAGPRSAPVPYPADAATAGGDAAMAAAMAPFMPARGLGRFAKPRSGAARPLI